MERRLVVGMRLVAVVMGLALVAVFMPRPWIAGIHSWLGLGPYPGSPVVDYLARSLSLFYTFAAVLLWLVSCDLRRYRPLLTYLILSGLAFGPIILFIDLSAGMPAWWTLGEGPLVFLLSLALWWAARGIPGGADRTGPP